MSETPSDGLDSVGVFLFFNLESMGQYHTLVNFDKQEVVSPRGIGLGMKQIEHTHTVATLSDLLYMLVSTSPNRGGGDLQYSSKYEREFKTFGRWVGDRVVIFGDYTEVEDVPFLRLQNGEALMNHVDTFVDISDSILPAFGLAFGIEVEKRSGWRKRELRPEEWSWLLPDR